jgi:hypothetical protein
VLVASSQQPAASQARAKDDIDHLSVSIPAAMATSCVSFPTADLPAPFVSLPTPIQLSLIRMATDFYTSLHADLRAEWDAALSADEAEKAAASREEGRKAGAAEMLTQLRDRLGAAEAMAVRLATVEEANKQLQAAAETEIEQRVSERLDGFRKDYEIQKLSEIAELRETVAKLTAREAMIDHMNLTVSLLTEKLEAREKQLADMTVATTKSSHAIGKAGEATVWEMIENTVLPEFMYAEAKNMSGVSHAADFHLSVMMASGRRIKILIDSKKYKRAVNTEEINKLISDVDGDDEAHAGMLVSLVSPICKTKQFQIKETDKGKPILYLSFMDIPQEQHAMILCWGVHALMAAVNETRESVSYDAEQINELLDEICRSLKEVDAMVKTHQKMIETLRVMKVGILNKITTFRGGAPVAPAVVAVDEGDVIIHEGGEGCISILKATGNPCGKPVVPGGLKCRHHTK